MDEVTPSPASVILPTAPISSWARRTPWPRGSVGSLITNTHAEHHALRPIERRVLRLIEGGVDVDEIGQRFRRSPDHIERLIHLARLPGRAARPHTSQLRPLERCILGWRAKGASYDEIAPRLAHSPEFVARVEAFARHKLADR